jgi:hypothetical protein
MQVSPTVSPGYCLASCGSAGCNVPLAACASSDTQRWLYDEQDRLVPLSDPLLCLEWTSPGTVVKLQACSTSTAQQWDPIGGRSERWCGDDAEHGVAFTCVQFAQAVDVMTSCCCQPYSSSGPRNARLVGST